MSQYMTSMQTRMHGQRRRYGIHATQPVDVASTRIARFSQRPCSPAGVKTSPDGQGESLWASADLPSGLRHQATSIFSLTSGKLSRKVCIKILP
jgi:hypothetical protein